MVDRARANERKPQTYDPSMRDGLFRTREGTPVGCEDCAKFLRREVNRGTRYAPGLLCGLAQVGEAEADAGLGEDVARDIAGRLDLAPQVRDVHA